MTMNSSRIALAIAAAGLLSACVSVLPKAPPAAARYLLSPVDFSAEEGPKVSWSLAVDDPQSTRVYDTTKIALVRAPGRVEYYATGEWADRGPRLVEAAIIRSFENSGRILGVGDRATMALSDFVLETDIRTLHATYENGAPNATIEIFARLTNGRGKIYAAKLFTHAERASADTEPEVVAAFDEAMTGTLRELVDWTFTQAAEIQAK